MIMMPYNCSGHRRSSQATQTSGTPQVQAGDRGGRQVQQHAVQQHDLLPVGVLPALGLGVAGDDRGLQLVGAGADYGG